MAIWYHNIKKYQNIMAIWHHDITTSWGHDIMILKYYGDIIILKHHGDMIPWY